MTEDQRFPTDDTTLTLLIAACQINPDTGRTHYEELWPTPEPVTAEAWDDAHDDWD